MLTGEPLGRALAQAIEKKKVSKAEVARQFDVKPPSVQDWIRYGRINKKHLDKLFAYFSDVVGPEHWGVQRTYPQKTDSANHVREEQETYDQPIKAVSAEELEVIKQIRLIPRQMRGAALKSIQQVLSAFVTANNATTHAGAGHGNQNAAGGREQKSRSKT